MFYEKQFTENSFLSILMEYSEVEIIESLMQSSRIGLLVDLVYEFYNRLPILVKMTENYGQRALSFITLENSQ